MALCAKCQAPMVPRPPARGRVVALVRGEPGRVMCSRAPACRYSEPADTAGVMRRRGDAPLPGFEPGGGDDAVSRRGD